MSKTAREELTSQPQPLYADCLWSVHELARYVGVPVKTIYAWRAKGYGPPGRRMGKHVRYRPGDVYAWVDMATEPAA